MNLKELKKEALESTTRILDCGGIVTFPYKGGMRDWFSEPHISKIIDHNGNPNYYVSGTPLWGIIKPQILSRNS